MKFTLHRNFVLTTTQGHAIEFVKDQPTHVPQAMWSAALGIGAQPEDELPETPVADTREPQDPIARKAAIFEGFEALVLGAKRDSFTGTGVPHIKSLTAQIGFVVDNKERDALWQEFKLTPKGE